jgi:hypothetical protein
VTCRVRFLGRSSPSRSVLARRTRRVPGVDDLPAPFFTATVTDQTNNGDLSAGADRASPGRRSSKRAARRPSGWQHPSTRRTGVRARWLGGGRPNDKRACRGRGAGERRREAEGSRSWKVRVARAKPTPSKTRWRPSSEPRQRVFRRRICRNQQPIADFCSPWRSQSAASVARRSRGAGFSRTRRGSAAR